MCTIDNTRVHMSHSVRKYEVYQIFLEMRVVLIVHFLSHVFFLIYYIHNLYIVNEKEINVDRRINQEKLLLDWLIFVFYSLSELYMYSIFVSITLNTKRV